MMETKYSSCWWIVSVFASHQYCLCVGKNVCAMCTVATSPAVLRWLCDSPGTGCAWRTTPYIYVAWTSNNRVIMACELHCCLLPRCEALRIYHSGFPIATILWTSCLLTNKQTKKSWFANFQKKCSPVQSWPVFISILWYITKGWHWVGISSISILIVVSVGDERSYIFQTQSRVLLLALRLLLRLRKILKHQLRLLLTLRKLQSNSYKKDSVYFAAWGKIYGVDILPLI